MTDVFKIVELHNEGFSYNEIARKLNLNKSIVAYYCNEKYNKKRIEKAKQKIEQQLEYEKIVVNVVKKCSNINQVCVMLNKRATNTNIEKINNIIKKYNIDIGHFSNLIEFTTNKRLTKSDIFCRDSKLKSTSGLYRNLMKYNLKEHKCECCGKIQWMINDQCFDIPLEVHHINGIRTDNRLENLQLLCRNCHYFTDNFCGKNIKNNKNKIRECKFCGQKFIKRNSEFCSDECSKQYISEQNNLKTKCPDKEILIKDILLLKSFVAMADKYDVSDKTISKWFRYYNLPYHKTELLHFLQNASVM